MPNAVVAPIPIKTPLIALPGCATSPQRCAGDSLLRHKVAPGCLRTLLIYSGRSALVRVHPRTSAVFIGYSASDFRFGQIQGRPRSVNSAACRQLRIARSDLSRCSQRTIRVGRAYKQRLHTKAEAKKVLLPPASAFYFCAFREYGTLAASTILAGTPGQKRGVFVCVAAAGQASHRPNCWCDQHLVTQ